MVKHMGGKSSDEYLRDLDIFGLEKKWYDSHLQYTKSSHVAGLFVFAALKSGSPNQLI